MRKKIVHIVLSGGWAGSEVAAFGIANAQVNIGYEVIVVVQVGAFSKKNYEDKLDSRIKLIPVSGAISLDRVIIELTEKLPNDISILHTHLGKATYVGKELKKKGVCNKVVAHMHIRFYAEQFNTVDAVVAVSEWQLRDIPSQYIGKRIVVQNFIDESNKRVFTSAELLAHKKRFYIQDNDFVFGIISRLHIEKGIDTAIRAMQFIDNPNVKLVIFGGGEEASNLKSLAKNDDRIFFGGFVNGGYPYMKLFDVYISPSRCESFGISQLEAYLSGVDVIASKTYGSLDLFESDSNLFEIDNEYDLARLMNEAIAGRLVSDIVLDKFDVDSNLLSLEKLYESI